MLRFAITFLIALVVIVIVACAFGSFVIDNVIH